MAAAIPDELLEEFAVLGVSWDEVVTNLRARLDGLLDRVAVYGGGEKQAVARACCA